MKTLDEVKREYLSAALEKPIEKFCIKDHTGRIVARSNSPVIHVFNNDTDDAYAAEHYKLKEVFNGMKFWWGVESPAGLFQSAAGGFYIEAELPEQTDEFCIRRYSNIMKAERNARITDTDDYVKLSDITVQGSVDAKRSALNEADKAALLAYRQKLRDLPEADGFPFVDFPDFPATLAYELEVKAKARNSHEDFK